MSGPAVIDTWVQRAQVLVDQKKRELMRLYPEAVASASVTRAWEAARRKARPIRPAVQGEAFYDLLTDELTQVDGWCQRFIRGMST